MFAALLVNVGILLYSLYVGNHDATVNYLAGSAIIVFYIIMFFFYPGQL